MDKLRVKVQNNLEGHDILRILIWLEIMFWIIPEYIVDLYLVHKYVKEGIITDEPKLWGEVMGFVAVDYVLYYVGIAYNYANIKNLLVVDVEMNV